MTQAAITPDAPHASQQPLRRQWRHGLRCLLRFITTPSDLANSFEAMFALAGPTVQKQFDEFASDPVGRRLLDERPRQELNELLCDRERLEALPKGSFADAYLDYMGGDGMGSADYFLEAADIDEKGARFGWSEDQIWFVKRMANSHDLFHVCSGYDREITGEVGVLAFTAGQVPLLPLRLVMLWLVTLKPSQPLRWLRFVRNAYLHGKRTPPLACVDYEAILPMPLEEARRAMGIAPMDEMHPGGVPGKGAVLEQLERRVELV